MDTKCAPPFANLFMASFEEKAIRAWTDKGGTPPTLWLRFLLIWEGSKDELLLFYYHLNTRILSIKLSMETGNHQFFGSNIYKGQHFSSMGKLDVKPYSKPTASFQFLHYKSCHAPLVLANIVKGEALRILRASSDKATYSAELDQLMKRFQKRGYPTTFINKAIEDVSYKRRSEFLTPRPDRALEESTAVLSVQQHPAYPSQDILTLPLGRESTVQPSHR